MITSFSTTQKTFLVLSLTVLVLFLELSDDRPNVQREKCALIFSCQCDRWIKQTSGADIKRWCTVAIKKTNLSRLSMYADEQARSARCLSSYCLADDRYSPISYTLAHGINTPTRFRTNKIGATNVNEIRTNVRKPTTISRTHKTG